MERHQPPPVPEPLPTAVLDSHTHLDLVHQLLSEEEPASEEQGEGQVTPTGGASTSEPTSPPAPPGALVEEQIEAAAAVGVTRLVQVGVDLASSRWGRNLAERHPRVLATVGLHPNEAPRLTDLDAALREVEKLANHPRVRGIGETGLDTYRTGEEGWAAQEESFRAHIAIAKRYGHALVIHNRQAQDRVLRILDEEGAPERVVMHCFSGDEEFAVECVRRGFLLSFAGTVTFRNAEPLRQAARRCPAEQMLVETDAPYLTPAPYRGRPNGPYLIPLTVRCLADTTGVPLDRLGEAISAAGEWAFGGWDLPS
jgi:TatD DNase family protein